MELLQPAILVIFGMTGDLAKRKLLPSLYQLADSHMLPESFKIVGISRRDTKVDDIIDLIKSSLSKADLKKPSHEETIKWLRESLTIVHMDMTQPDDYSVLKQKLDAIEDSVGVCLNRLFYLAIPSTLFRGVIRRLGSEDLNHGCQHGVAESRVLIEKPFGYDLVSAEELIHTLAESFDIEQIYRIDHYLAKDTAQNILTFRFENPLLTSTWDNKHISHIIISATESIDIEGRATFYDQIGALRDLVQSHLLQILALVTMEKPIDSTAERIHESKVNLLNQVLPPKADRMAVDAIRGQYENYQSEVSNPKSQTETYAAIKLYIDNDRWEGVPIYIRTGKSLKEKVTEVTMVFYDTDPPDCENRLTIRIQPNEGIALSLRIKKPGFEDKIENINLDFYYKSLSETTHHEAYERVLVDAIRGDKTLFATSHEVLASWRIIEPILQAWGQDQSPLYKYKAGSWGPKAGTQMPGKDGESW
ncbi:MAG: glucose-6-phosphate dehydrogenase [Candidatus Saccharimonadales bacterium]